MTRSGGYCERCGLPLAATWARHHRQLRSQGGRDHIENLLAIHHHCHEFIHNHPKHAIRDGFIVSRESDPAQIPLWHASEVWVRLRPDGQYGNVADGKPVDLSAAGWGHGNELD